VPNGSEAPAGNGPESRVREAVAKPLLASEALMEDLAPVEPARRAARVWCAALGLAFLALGALPLLGLREGGVQAATPSFVFGGIALLAALAPVTYRLRAAAMVVLGILSAATGLRGVGPAMGIAVGGMLWGICRVVAASTLPAALLFRARYRAYSGARWILGVAFLSALPFLVLAAVTLLRFDFGLQQIGACIAVIAIVGSLPGFMGSETTGAASLTGPGVIVGLSAELLLHALSTPDTLGSWASIGTIAISTAAFAGTSVMAALGLFQILASRFCADARRIDLHAQPRQATKSSPSSSSGDWSTRV
jgi:hypothetical protein